jgi:hypothetical protein
MDLKLMLLQMLYYLLVGYVPCLLIYVLVQPQAPSSPTRGGHNVLELAL